MRLNNHGWGYKSLIFWGCVFLISLLFAAIGIRSMVRRYKKEMKEDQKVVKEDKNKAYHELEDKMVKAGEDYARNHNTLLTLTNETIVIPYDELKDYGYIDFIIDPKSKDECTGYVSIKSDSDIEAYIKCNNYISSEYYNRME